MRSGRRWTTACALLAIAACRPAGPQPVAVPVGLPAEEPLVRVGVHVEAAEVVVGATTRYEVAVAGTDGGTVTEPDERWTFTADSAGFVIGRSEGGRRLGPIGALLRVQPLDRGTVLIEGRPYRGAALIRGAGPGRVTAINVVELESYLLGVVPHEIGVRPAAEIEAVKAQAVAARTYAIGNLGSRETFGFDVFATVDDQVYGGVAQEEAVATRAVAETRGEILTHAGSPILAYYHSTCGGRTAAIEEVWPRAPLPYLKSVSDAIPGTDRHYCDFSNRFRWTTTWSGAELLATLSRTLVEVAGAQPGTVQRILGVQVAGRTASGRNEAVRVTTNAREYIVRGDSTRWLLSPEPGRILNSARFDLTEERGADGAVVRLVADGGGWGHGVGMCQIGAIGRARAGHAYRQILGAYYRDTRVQRLY